jgi:hypothetical protein
VTGGAVSAEVGTEEVRARSEVWEDQGVAVARPAEAVQPD